MCENEAERHVWRANVLRFMRDHIDINETYRLGEGDLAFGELLPGKPGWLDQRITEERTRVWLSASSDSPRPRQNAIGASSRSGAIWCGRVR